jgi:hypothetical protein
MSTKTSYRRTADRLVRRATRAELVAALQDRGCRAPRRDR